MIDQAAALRSLVRRQAGREADGEPERRLPMVLVVGGKGGVGTTTLSVHLSAGLAKLGGRPLLIDADLYRADAAMMCGVAERRTVVDVSSGRCALSDAMVAGPLGIHVLPGLWGPGRPVAMTEATWRRVRQAIDEAADRVDRVVIDTGSGNVEVRRKMWSDADDVIVVTRPHDLAVMDAYATIKLMQQATREGPVTRLHLVVNGVTDSSQGADVFRRIERSCGRFLGIELNDLGAIPEYGPLQASRDVAAVLRAVPELLDVARRFAVATPATLQEAA